MLKLIYPTDLDAARTALTDLPFTVVDIETNAYDLGDPRFAIRTIQLGNAEAVVVLDASSDDHRELAREALVAAPKLVAHNAAFDLVALAHEGIIADLRAVYSRTVDTYVAAMLISPSVGSGERTRGSRYGLKPLAASLAGDRAVSARAKSALKRACEQHGWGSMDPQAYGPSAWSELDITDPAFVDYAVADIIDTALVADVLVPLVTMTVSSQAWDRERRLACEAALMQLRGVALDRDFTAARLAEQQRIVADAEAELDAVLVDLDFDSDGHKRFSPEHLAAAVVNGEGLARTTTANGQTATGRAVLEAWAEQGSRVAGPWQRRRDAVKLISTYYERYLRSGGDRIHPTLIPLKAATGRMASEAPNFQNLPARDPNVRVRECFVADAGKVFISADFSSIEMRIAAAVTGDERLVAMYTTDPATVDDPRTLDPYWVLALELYGADATKAHRQAVKSVVLGRMYGGGVETLSEGAGLTMEQGRAVLRTYDATYAGLAPWAREQIHPLCDAGRPYWQLPSGRYQAINPGHAWKATNTVIQGYARDVLADAMLRVADDPELGPGLVMPIHDELLVQVPEASAEALLERLVALMTTSVEGIPIPAEGVVLGPRWTAK